MEGKRTEKDLYPAITRVLLLSTPHYLFSMRKKSKYLFPIRDNRNRVKIPFKSCNAFLLLLPFPPSVVVWSAPPKWTRHLPRS